MLKSFVFILLPMLALGITLEAASEEPVNVAGTWQVSWQVRLGTEPGTLQLHQKGSTLNGTWRGLHNSSSVSGGIRGNNVSFTVQFQGVRPFTIQFTGTVDGDKMKGVSEAQNVEEGGAFLGHGGEVTNPTHPWTAIRQNR